MSDVLDLARDLIRRPSVTPDDAGCQALIAERLEAAGMTVEWFPSGAVSNLLLTHGDGAPHLMLLGHTDVVPPGPENLWTSPPFAPEVRNGVLYGRGAADMKSSVAAFVVALEAFLEAHPGHAGTVSLLLTSDEEGPARDGTRVVADALAERDRLPDHCLVGEPSSTESLGDTLRIGRRGSIQACLTVRGVQGHTAYADPAENPVHRAAPVLADLAAMTFDDGDEHFPATRLQVSNVAAGTGADNVTPGEITVWFNLRHHPGTSSEALEARIRDRISDRHPGEWTLDWRVSGVPFGPATGALAEAAALACTRHRGHPPRRDTGGGTSDGRFLGPLGVEVVELGPVNATIHRVDECMEIKDRGFTARSWPDCCRAPERSNSHASRPVLRYARALATSYGNLIMRKLVQIGLILGMVVSSVTASESPEIASDNKQIWGIWGGELIFEIRTDTLSQFEIETYHSGNRVEDVQSIPLRLRSTGSLSIEAPYGNFERFLDGQIGLDGGISFHHKGNRVSLEGATLAGSRVDGQPALVIVGAAGNPLFHITNLHIETEPYNDLLTMSASDIRATEYIETALGIPHAKSIAFGTVAGRFNLHIPYGADLSQRGPGCSNPEWPNDGHTADVTLISIGDVSQMGGPNGSGFFKVAPSATLRNEGTADIPWVPKFDQIPQYTHSPRDQHPFLVWAMYREVDGRFEMISNSGTKHAFLTVNTGCACSSGNILWNDCEDTYATGTNDSGTVLGPLSEIDANIGLFESTCSFFDPDCNSVQTNWSSTYENRLLVHPTDLDVAGATYYLDSWYIVQYDINIWNTMGYREINPSSSGGGWTFSPFGNFVQAPVVGEWVAENTTDPMEAHEIIVVPSETPGEPYPGNMPQGHLRLLVKVTEVSPDRWRYNYALQNYDFDRGVTGVSIPKEDAATVFETYFGDIDSNAGNDWTVTDNGTSMDYTADSEDDKQTWFRLYNYEIETSVEPHEGMVTLEFASGATPSSVQAPSLVPRLPEEFFEDGFESGK